MACSGGDRTGLSSWRRAHAHWRAWTVGRSSRPMEHTSIVSVTDGDLVPPGPRALSGCSRELVSPEALAFNIRSGCVYDAQPSETFGLLVTRSDPRTRRGTKHGRSQVRASIHAHWPLFAPSMQLLTGHDAPCHARRCHGVGRCADHMAHVPP